MQGVADGEKSAAGQILEGRDRRLEDPRGWRRWFEDGLTWLMKEKGKASDKSIEAECARVKPKLKPEIWGCGDWKGGILEAERYFLLLIFEANVAASDTRVTGLLPQARPWLDVEV